LDSGNYPEQRIHVSMDFTSDSYYRENFINISLASETVKSIDFEECEFNGCSFIGCIFEKCKFVNCTFTGCVLSAINPVNSWITEVKFIKCKVIGCDWTKTSQVHGLDFADCQLNYSNFAMLKIPKIKIIGCEAKEADFTETDLSDGDFCGTDLEGSIFSKTNLTRANLAKAVNYSIDPRCNTLKKTRFSLPEALSLLNCLDIIID